MMKSGIILLMVVIAVGGSFIEDWRRMAPADSQHRVSFFVALKQRNVDKLEALLYSVSDPASPDYGREVSKDEVASLVYPPKEEHDRVFNFFSKSLPSSEITSYGDSLKISATVEHISSVFKTQFHVYHHVPSSQQSVRAPEISIPAEIKDDIHMITNLVSLPLVMKNRKVEPVSSGVVLDTHFGSFAPSTLRRLYTKVSNEGSSQCALEFTPEAFFSESDYVSFCKLADEEYFNYTHILGPVIDGDGWDNTESQLDVQVLGTIGLGADNWFWTISDGWIYEMAVQIYNNETKPWVFSISYGWPEVLTCGSVAEQANCGTGDNQQYITRANTELAKLGTARISVIVCSQDEGAPSSANMACSNDTHPIFGIYPASSPFATTVSSTSAVVDPNGEHTLPPIPQVPVSIIEKRDKREKREKEKERKREREKEIKREKGRKEGNDNEKICLAYDNYPCSNSSLEYASMVNNTAYSWTTGGGFSEFTSSPSYQQMAVAAYFASNITKPPTMYTWPKNRGYPDVSAIGARVLIVNGGAVSVMEGTSASTPVFAGIITLLNDERLNTNKTTLGFLNPMLYQMAQVRPSAFNDITIGSNECTQGGQCCDYGYYAGSGWDPVTGLGTPNYGEMLTYVKTLP